MGGARTTAPKVEIPLHTVMKITCKSPMPPACPPFGHHLMRHASCGTPHASRFMRHASCVTHARVPSQPCGASRSIAPPPLRLTRTGWWGADDGWNPPHEERFYLGPEPLAMAPGMVADDGQKNL